MQYCLLEVSMTKNTEKILNGALGLPPTERAELVERILSSFNFPDRKDIDAAWAREAEERIDAFERGDIQAIPADKVFERIDGPESA